MPAYRRKSKNGWAWVTSFVMKFPDGSRKRVRERSPINTRDGALEFERAKRNEMMAAFGQTPKKAIKTFAEFREAYFVYSKNNNKPSTVRVKAGYFEQHLDAAFGALPLDQIDRAKIEAYKAKKLDEGLSPGGVNNHLINLRKLLNLAVEMGELGAAPRVRRLPTPDKEIVFLDFDEAARLVAAARPEWRTMILVALKTGLRRGELRGLKWSDIDLKAARLHVRRSVWHEIEGTPKSGKARVVPLCAEARDALAAHRHMQGDYVFCKEDGSRLTHSEVEPGLRYAIKRSGLAKKIGWHTLRHTFASHLVMRAVPIVVVKEYMGHGDLQMTMRYAHLTPAFQESWIKVLDAPSDSWHNEGTSAVS